MTFTNDCPCGRSQIFTALEEIALANSHLLPETKKVVYFVTAMQGESKKIIYIGFTSNLRRKFKDHKRKMEFEFLDRMGYQINTALCLTIRYNTRGGKKEKNETLLPRYASKDR